MLKNVMFTAFLLCSAQAVAQTPEEKGLDIATKADVKEQGYGDYTMETEMVLHNGNGESATRYMRQMAFEVTDKDKGDKTLVVFDKPLDVRGTAFLTHANVLEADDQWLYLPELGKVKRISSRNKSGPFMGSEFSYEDMSTAEVGKYSYKYITEENCGTHASNLTCHKIERTPLYKYSGYTKQFVWLDTAELRTQKVESYDRKGELLKTMTAYDYQQYKNKFWRPRHVLMVNNQSGKSTDLYWSDFKFQTGLSENDFNKAVLKNIR